MPLVQISMLAGRTDEQKKALIQKVTKVVCETLNCDGDAVSVILQDVAPTEWGRAGQTVAERRGIK